MILILSNENDTSTSQVIDWLIHFKADYLRINEEDRFNLIDFKLSNNDFALTLLKESTEMIVDFTMIKCVWYRRGDIVLNAKNVKEADFPAIFKFVNDEYKVLHEFIFDYIESLPRIDSYFRRSLNKLRVLNLAKSVGLKIPDTYIFEGNYRLPKNEEYITKAIFEVFSNSNGTTYSTPTKLVKHDANITNHSNSLSLCQFKIEKECDLRIFYLFGNFYSMAIMSQNNDKSKIDFRHYPSDPPNRSFRFNCSSKIKSKITKLMKTLKLDSGSIDMVLDTKGDFYFLEINPVGQFGMTSYPCNYFLEKNIAISLIKLSENF